MYVKFVFCICILCVLYLHFVFLCKKYSLNWILGLSNEKYVAILILNNQINGALSFILTDDARKDSKIVRYFLLNRRTSLRSQMIIKEMWKLCHVIVMFIENGFSKSKQSKEMNSINCFKKSNSRTYSYLKCTNYVSMNLWY